MGNERYKRYVQKVKEEVRKFIQCDACGYEFTPSRDTHYLAIYGPEGILKLSSETILYDAWDCPICGRQAHTLIRKFSPHQSSKEGILLISKGLPRSACTGMDFALPEECLEE